MMMGMVCICDVQYSRVLVCSGCMVCKHRNVILTALGLEVPDQVLSDLVSTETLLLGPWMDVFLLCPHGAEGPEEFP